MSLNAASLDAAKSNAVDVFTSLLGEDGHVSFAKFEAFFNSVVHVPAAAPALALHFAAPLPHAAPPQSAKKKRVVIDDDDDFDEFEHESPQRKKTKSKDKKASAAAGKSTMTKAIKSARLKSVLSSLKSSIKTKKFYSGYDSRCQLLLFFFFF